MDIICYTAFFLFSAHFIWFSALLCICVSSPTNRLLHDFFRFGFFVGLLLLPLTRSLWFLLFPLNIRLPIEHRIRINLMLLMQTCELYWYWPFIRIHMLFSSTFCCCYCRCCFLPLRIFFLVRTWAHISWQIFSSLCLIVGRFSSVDSSVFPFRYFLFAYPPAATATVYLHSLCMLFIHFCHWQNEFEYAAVVDQTF